jgi:4-amino-4-deoxy-L-arabinose transferase-like glycosyltransferase
VDERFASRGWQALMLGAAALLLLTRLGSLDLWAPDEPRYAQVAEEVRSLERGAGSLFLLTLNGQPYDQKPPVYYWMAALAGASSGRVTEAAARLPSALAGVALAGIVLAFGARLLGRSSASFGAGFLVTAWLFAHLARRAQLDVLLALFEALALVGFWRLDREIGSRRANLLLMHAAMGLGMLTKWLGVLLPTLIIVGFLGWEGRLRTIRRFFPLRYLALSVLPTLLWLALATSLAPDGYLRGAVVDNAADHFVNGAAKPNPWFYYLLVFPLDFLPWSALWPLVYWVGRREIFAAGAPQEPQRAWRFLLAWVGVSFLFFSISSGKRDLYLIPCYPAVALLCGDAVVRGWRALPALPEWAGRGLGGFAALLAAGAVVVAVLPLTGGVSVPLSFSAAVIAALLAGWALWRRAGASSFGALGQLATLIGVVVALELAAFTLLLPAFEAEKSTRPVALAAASLAAPGEPIGLVEQGPAVGGLAYYSGRRVRELGPAENLRRFFSEGGHVAVVLADALARVHGEEFSEVRARFRTGKRATLIVTPRRAPASNEDPAAGEAAGDPPARPGLDVAEP